MTDAHAGNVIASDAQRPLPALLCLVALFLALTWPAILSGREGTSEAYDQRHYHEPVIEKIVEQWPHPDFVNYRSATTPGYHLLMATIKRYLTDSPIIVRLISNLFSLGFLLVVFGCALRYATPWQALMLVMPLACSTYLLAGSIWLTTDNLGWLFVSVALGAAVMSKPTAARFALGGIAVLAVTFVRQIHIWTAAPVALAALLQSPLANSLPKTLRHDDHNQQQTWLPLIAAGFFIAAAFALLGAFVLAWGGLTPPAFTEQHARGPNLATIPLTLSLVGVFGMFFLPAFGGYREAFAFRSRTVVLVAIAAAVLCMLMPTSYAFDDGRRGGPLWHIVRLLPVFADRSIVFPLLAAVGALVLLQAWRSVVAAGNRQPAMILLLGMLGWVLAQSMNFQAWQRYCEPIILVMLIWLAALAQPHQTERAANRAALPQRWWIGPIALSIVQFSLTAAGVYWPMIRDAM